MKVRVLTIAALALMVLTFPTGASAHAGTYYYQSNYAYVNSTHTSITVCDQESDSNGFYALVEKTNGASFYVHDTNGSAAGCGYLGGISPSIRYITLCEDAWFACTGKIAV